jgi:hypothetical protein
MKYKKQKIAKMNKWDLMALKKKKLEDSLKGAGRFLFVNNTRGELFLLKPPLKGRNPVPAGQTFEGDSFFNYLLKTGEARLVEVIESPNAALPAPIPTPIVEGKIMDKKLMLDQPERFTNQGQTEQVIIDPKKLNKPLNENQPAKSNRAVDKLLTEDPMAGVEIILN